MALAERDLVEVAAQLGDPAVEVGAQLGLALAGRAAVGHGRARASTVGELDDAVDEVAVDADQVLVDRARRSRPTVKSASLDSGVLAMSQYRHTSDGKSSSASFMKMPRCSRVENLPPS
jgi:hypothetical protein